MNLQTNKTYLGALYLRLSREDVPGTEEAPRESNSIRSQRDLLLAYLKTHDEIRLVGEYADDGYSGSDFSRPAFRQMMEDIKKKKVNCILVKDLSRFGRNYIETGRYLERVFPVLGVRFIAVNDDYDSDNQQRVSDQLLIPFKNLINDAYCRDISLKIRSHLDVKRKNGEFIGSFAAYGYQKDPVNKNHLIIDEEAARTVRFIFHARIKGMGSARIAERLNKMGILPPGLYKKSCGLPFNGGFQSGETPGWSAVSVDRILKNELYTGTLVQGKTRKINYKVKKCVLTEASTWIRAEADHAPIVSRQEFQQVQELLRLDTRTTPSKEAVCLFSGLLLCGDCKESMVRRSTTKGKKKYYYYHCSTYKKKSGCRSHLIDEESLKRTVCSAIRERAAQLAQAVVKIKAFGLTPLEQSIPSGQNFRLTKLQTEAARYQRLTEHLGEDRKRGMFSTEEYERLHRRFADQKKAAEQALAKVKRESAPASFPQEVLLDWAKGLSACQDLIELDRETVVNFISKITVYENKQIQIQFRFEEELRMLLTSAYDGEKCL